MKVVYFGTPSIAANILEFLLQNSIHIVGVVTKPDKPQGRQQKLQPSAVKQKVLEKYSYIPILQPPKISTPEYAEKLKAFNADVFVVVAYGEIVKESILSIPPQGCINVHASLLPKYRGAAPMHRAIINGEVETGVTIMEMVAAMDAGDILYQIKTPISRDMNVGELEKILEKIGGEALLETLQNLKAKRAGKQVQDEHLVTYAPKITSDECEVLWNKPAVVIHHLVRGVTPFPGAWCRVRFDKSTDSEEKRLKIKKTVVVSEFADASPGSIVKYTGDEWWVATGQGIIQLLEVQLEGKKAVSASEFIRGYSQPEFLSHC